jgi:hypothetical protein
MLMCRVSGLRERIGDCGYLAPQVLSESLASSGNERAGEKPEGIAEESSATHCTGETGDRAIVCPDFSRGDFRGRYCFRSDLPVVCFTGFFAPASSPYSLLPLDPPGKWGRESWIGSPDSVLIPSSREREMKGGVAVMQHP